MERDDPQLIADLAGRILSERTGGSVRLRAGTVWTTPGSTVVRCRADAAPPSVPPTVIAKRARDADCPYHPDSPDSPNAAHGLFNDWAGAEFLGRVDSDPPLAPALHGGSRALGIVLLEDLGDGEAPNTADALLGRDPGAAEAALVEHAALLGRLHASTLARGAEYRRVRRALGPPPRPEPLFHDPWSESRESPIPPSEIGAAVREYGAALGGAGLRPRRGAEEEIAHVAVAVEQDPDPWLAYCKGDQNAAGDYIRLGGRPRLFDFGAGGVRHALIEGMPGRMTWGCMMRIPRGVLPAMEAAYRAELARAYADAARDDVWARGMAEAGARWHVLHVIHRLPEALAGDRPRGLTTLRQQVVAWVGAFAELSDELGRLPALGASARQLAERLRAAWPDAAELPPYPAFRRG